MVTKKTTDYYYAEAVTSQTNPNKTQRVSWSNIPNATGHSLKDAVSQFTVKARPTHYTTKDVTDKNGKVQKVKVADKVTTVYNRPWVLASYDFRLDIPASAHIHKVTFELKAKVDKNVDVLQPIGAFRLAGKNHPATYDYNDSFLEGVKTGWHEDYYLVVPTKKMKSSSYEIIEYTMNEADLKKNGVTPAKLNREIMGIDFLWRDPSFKQSNITKLENEILNKSDKSSSTYRANVYVQWIRMKVVYDVPDYKVTFVNPIKDTSDIIATSTILNRRDTDYTTVNNINTSYLPKGLNGTKTDPFQVWNDTTFLLNVVVKNPNVAKGKGDKVVKLDLPWGTEIVGSPICEVGSFNKTTNEWTIPIGSKVEYTCELKLKSHKNGLSDIRATLNTSSTSSVADYYYRVNQNEWDGGLNDIRIEANNTARKYTKTCVTISIHGQSNDAVANYTIPNLPIIDGAFTLMEELTTEGVSIASQTQNSLSLNVPSGEAEFDAILHYCFYPTAVGTLNFAVIDEENNRYTKPLDVLESYTYKFGDTTGEVSSDVYEIGFSPSDIYIGNHRIASDLEGDVTVIPCIADDVDASMVSSECRINMSIWEELDYIGCIPLEHLHFDPKSTMKDTLLNQTYKNKKYMGKKLATDEDITLNVRLHPKQVTTLQGLLKMDKPIPINANHKCFEGDALNHRGWCELYGVKVEETNPRWYKCDIDVKYLTHNLNTRFKITRAGDVSDYEFPQLMAETYSSGDDLSLDNIYFDVDTDGTFYYNEDADANERNTFNIDNGQHILITTAKPISHSSAVSFEWTSVLIDEIRENNVSRIIRLVDKTGKIYFQYQYDNIQVSDDDVTAEVKYWVLEDNDELVDYNTTRDITFRYNATDSTQEDTNENAEFTEEEDVDLIETGDAHFGTDTTLSISNNKLKLVDSGFNGKEITIDGINLKGEQYYYQVEWINNNADAETSDVDCIFDFTVQDTILTSTYAESYGDLVVSPFPVPNKKIVFTRDAEEGTIFYYKDDEEEFSYINEPYYQYMNGTNLLADGIEVFDIDYGYEVVHIQNGLVRLGFNRLTGAMYLGKFDTQSSEYITTHQFYLEKFDDINVNALSDDKIEVQASDCTFTIYRGHPYIKIKHELEDIYIDTVFNRVWAEQTGESESLGVPAYWDLLNDANLLPLCVTGDKGLKSSCVETSEPRSIDRLDTSITLTDVSQIENDTTFTIDTSTVNYSDEVYLEDGECSFGQYTVEIISDGLPTLLDGLTATKDIIQTGESDNLLVKLTDSGGNGVNGQTVEFLQYNPLLFYFEGRGGFEVDSWSNLDSRVSVTSDDTGTTVKGLSSGLYTMFANVYSTDSTPYDFDNDVIVEFDVVECTSAQSGRFQFYDGDDSHTFFAKNLYSDIGARNGSHITVTMTNGLVEVYVDGVKNDNCTVQTNFTNPYHIGFRGYQNWSFKFKNFIIGGF